MVRASPSFSEIVGAHPSSVDATVMSGRRTFGSSDGSGRNSRVEELPVAANSGDEGRSKNRRVEVWVY